MQIAYNKNADIYCIELQYPETEIYIKANDTMEVRQEFLDRMAWLFDKTIREKLS